MRVLTVRQPWAWAIIHGGKDVENRSRSLGPYRGPVLIHAGLAWDDKASWNFAWPALSDALDAASVNVWDEPSGGRGAIIGVVDLVGVHEAGSGACIRQVPCDDRACRAHSHGDYCSDWAERRGHHLVMQNPRALDEPIPYKGGLGLRKTRFDVAGQWLVEQTDRCTCGAGPSLGAVFGHGPGCGLEQVALLLNGATP